MPNVASRFGTRWPSLCAVCRRRAWCVGYAPKQQLKNVIWLCDNSVCHELGKVVHKMPEKNLCRYEDEASIEAMDSSGEYLAEIGKFDLRDLCDGELAEFRRRFVVGFEISMRDKLAKLL